MATTSIHIPGDLLEKLDQLARDKGISRNRLIVESCRLVVERHRERWPPGYLEGAHLDDKDREILAESAHDFLSAIERSRASRAEAPF